MAHIKEVAEKAGVSISTVSRALSGKVVVDPETKKRVIQAVRELNYQPNVLAKSLKEGHSKTIGLILPNLKNLVFPAAIRGITEVAKKYGYTLILCNTDEDLDTEKRYVDNLKQRFTDGLIFSTATSASSHIHQLKEEGYPVVLILRALDEEYDTIMINNFDGGYQATKFLLERGYRKIALINGSLNLKLYKERFEGYLAALKEAGVPVDDQLVVHQTQGWEDGFTAVRKLLERGVKFDAVFGTSDPKALGAMKALKEYGLRVPDNVAVIGYDNLDTSELTDPPLTTMAQPFYEVGKQAAERLLKLIKSKKKPKPELVKLDTKLLIRKSVGFGSLYQPK